MASVLTEIHSFGVLLSVINRPMHLSPIRALITGFGPFPGVVDNPSARLMRFIVEQPYVKQHDIELTSHVLPTAWKTVKAEFDKLVEDIEPNIVIHFGVDRSADSLRVETVAHNSVSCSVDADGELPVEAEVLKGAPASLHTNIPIKALLPPRYSCELKMDVSDDAGRYLCNFLYYHSLYHALEAKLPRLVSFVHIPLIPHDLHTFRHADVVRPPPQITLSDLATGAIEIVRNAAHHYRGQFTE